MHIYRVGDLYVDNRTHWPECAQYNYRGGEHELILFFDRPTPEEVKTVSKARAEFALFVERSLIVMMYRFGQEVPWSDAPYSIHLVPREERVVPPVSLPTEWALLHIILVDASSGVIRAMRVLSMPPEFTQALHRAIQEQAEMPFTRAKYNGELEQLFAGYSSFDLARMSGVRFSSKP
jgi:hypothetical protein